MFNDCRTPGAPLSADRCRGMVSIVSPLSPLSSLCPPDRRPIDFHSVAVVAASAASAAGDRDPLLEWDSVVALPS
jgi:hypothetical protein